MINPINIIQHRFSTTFGSSPMKMSSFQRDSMETLQWLLLTYQYHCLLMGTGGHAAVLSHDQDILRKERKERKEKKKNKREREEERRRERKRGKERKRANRSVEGLLLKFWKSNFLLFWRKRQCSEHVLEVPYKDRRWVGASGSSMWHEHTNPGAAKAAAPPAANPITTLPLHLPKAPQRMRPSAQGGQNPNQPLLIFPEGC